MTGPAVTIAPISGPADLAEVTRMVWAFFDEAKARDPSMADDVDAYIAHHDVAGDLARLAPPDPAPGTACLLARRDGAACGTLMLRPFAPGLCEMNRMYVDPSARGHGIGRALVLALFDAARALGYSRMRLSTVTIFPEAIALYRSLGFTDTPDPTDFERERDHVISLVRDLSDADPH